MSNETRVMLKNVRLAFPVLAEPQAFQGTGNPRYSATLLLEKDSPNHKACIAAMRAAAVAKWGENKADKAVKALSANLKTALGDGDVKAEYDGFEGMMFVSAHSQAATPPRLLDGNKNDLPRNTSVIYPGCYVHASVEWWGQDNQYGKRINAQIRGLQFAGDGDSFAAGSAADPAEFEVVEGVADEAEDEDFA